MMFLAGYPLHQVETVIHKAHPGDGFREIQYAMRLYCCANQNDLTEDIAKRGIRQ